MKKEFAPFQYRSDLMGKWEISDKNTIYRFHYGFIRNIISKMRKHIYYLMRDRGMRFENAINFLMDKTNNNPETIFGYIEQIHQHNKTEVSECDFNHPLENKLWNVGSVDLKDIKKKFGDFDERPKK